MIRYFIMLRDVDDCPCPVVDEIEMVQLFDSKVDAEYYAKTNCYHLYGYVIYEWSEQ